MAIKPKMTNKTSRVITKIINKSDIRPPSVFIIALQYNNSQDTLRCLESLKELDYPNYKVVVVDNASQEAEINNIRQYLKSKGLQGSPLETFESKGRPWIIENKENLGYAGGNNVGIKYALENGADYVFVLNNDTTVEPDALKKLITAAEADSKIGIVGPAIQEEEKRVYFGKISWFKAELKHVYRKSEILPLENSRAKSRGSRVGGISDFLGPKEYVIGAATLIKKEVLEKIEGFDEIYFLYFEDADFSIRAQIAGYKLKVVPEAVVNHKVSASTKHLGSPLILRYHMRNALIFNSLNAPWTIKPFLIFWAGYIVLKNLVKMFIMPPSAPSADAIIEGIIDFYKNKFERINV